MVSTRTTPAPPTPALGDQVGAPVGAPPRRSPRLLGDLVNHGRRTEPVSTLEAPRARTCLTPATVPLTTRLHSCPTPRLGTESGSFIPGRYPPKE